MLVRNLLSYLSYQLFIDDSLLISQEKHFEESNTNFFCSYSIISSLFSLVIKHNKSEVFHFSKLSRNFDPSFLNLRPLKRIILKQKNT